MGKQSAVESVERGGASGRAAGVRVALSRWRRRGASAVEAAIVTGTVALGAAAGYQAMGSSINTKITCFGERLMGTASSCDGDSTIGPTAGMIRGEDPPLKTTTFRITDDNIPTGKVTGGTPGLNMDVAGNSTMTWVYGRHNIVGACKSLASHMSLSDPNALFSGGTCLQVGNYPTIFRVEDQLEDWQACSSPEHIDFHVGELGHQQTDKKGQKYYDGPLGQYLHDHPNQAHYVPVSCGSPDSAIIGIFRDYDPKNDMHKQIRFDYADGPVTGAVLHINGKTIHGQLQANGSFLFEDFGGKPITGTGKFDLTVQEPDGSTKTQHATLQIPGAGQISGTQIKGNDVQRGGSLDTLEVHQGETVQQAVDRAQKRKQCLDFLKSNKYASASEAAKHGCY